MKFRRFRSLIALFIPLCFLAFTHLCVFSAQCREKMAENHSCCDEEINLTNSSTLDESSSSVDACCFFNSCITPVLPTSTQRIEKHPTDFLSLSSQVFSKNLFTEQSDSLLLKSNFNPPPIPLFILKDSYLI